MIIQKIDPSRFVEAYGIFCQKLYPVDGTRTPFASTWCVIEPGGATAPHDHHEGETFYIVEGRGRMRILDDEADLDAGSVVLIPPFSNHTLTNTSSTHRLVFVSIYWENENRLWEGAPPRRALIFSAPPTPNGDLHLGHLSGPYIAADVFRRFLRANGVEAVYVCGSDDNQSYVPTKAKALAMTPHQVIDRFGTSIRKTLALYDAAPDYFLEPQADPAYVEYIQAFFNKMRERGKIELRSVDTPYCPTCELFLYEAHVHGGCPSCGQPTNGNGCEECGRTNDCVNLVAPTCNHCGQRAEMRAVEKYYFPLSRYEKALRAHLSAMDLPSDMRNFAMALLDEGLPDVTATHLSKWGIPAPNADGQVVYAWFEMAAGYLYMAEKFGGVARYFSGDGAVFGFFGFDNAFFYLTFIPAILMAWDEEIKLPSACFINQFFLLDGLKFSTSRNHAVWGHDIVAHLAPDPIRFFLAQNRPELEQTNFTLDGFAETLRSELVGQWEAFFAEMDRALEGVTAVPASPREPSGRLRAFRNGLEADAAQVTQSLTAGSFSLRETVVGLSQLVARSRRFLAAQHPLQPTKGWHDSLGLLCTAVKALGVLSGPLMPALGAHLLQKFGLDSTVPWGDATTPMTTGTAISPLPLHDGRFSDALRALEAFSARREVAVVRR